MINNSEKICPNIKLIKNHKNYVNHTRELLRDYIIIII